MFSGKVFDDFNFAEAFFDRRRNQLCGHPIEHMPGDIPVSGCVARFADFQRHVEKDGAKAFEKVFFDFDRYNIREDQKKG